MAKTSTFSVTTAATAVTTLTATRSVTVQEDPSVASFPTTDFRVMAPASTDVAIQVSSGNNFTFVCQGAFYPAGATVGYVKTVSGTTTFQQFETGY